MGNGTWIWDIENNCVVADPNLIRMFSLPPSGRLHGCPIEEQFPDSPSIPMIANG